MTTSSSTLPYELLIFDWDGTLMDSAGEIVAVMQKAIQETGLPERSPDQLRDLIGLGLHEALSRLFPELDAQRLRDWLSVYRRRYMSPSSRALLFPTVQETLQQLLKQGYVLAVATGKSRRGLDRAMTQANLDGYFRYTRCADEAASKPAPDMVEDILLRAATRPERALVIGDTEYDMAMARAAGVAAVGVLCGVHHGVRLRASGASALLETVADLPAWLAASASPERSGQGKVRLRKHAPQGD